MPTLFGGATPGGAEFLDGSPGLKRCLTFNFAKLGQITEVWWWCGVQTGGTWTAVGWDITTGDSGGAGAGTQIINQAFVGTPTANAWNKVVLSAAADVTSTAKRYRVGIHNTQYYWADNGYFNGHDEISGDISALRNDDSSSALGTLKQGTFAVSSSVTTYPQLTGTQANYAVDVTFVPAAADAIAPTGIAVAATTGSTALSQAFTVAPSGIAVPATAGGMTLSQALAVAPSGIAVPAATGATALSQAFAVAPSGIAVPATTGTPSVSQTIPPSFACSPAGIAIPVAPGQPAVQQISIASEGSWAGLLNAVNSARADHALAEERRHRPLQCPEHLWPLERAGGVYHCKFGGHVVRTY